MSNNNRTIHKTYGSYGLKDRIFFWKHATLTLSYSALSHTNILFTFIMNENAVNPFKNEMYHKKGSVRLENENKNGLNRKNRLYLIKRSPYIALVITYYL